VLVDARTGKTRTLGSAACGAGWRGLSFSGDSKLFAAGTFCGQVFAWNVSNGRRVGRPFSIGGELADIAFSPARIWDARSLSVLRVLKHPDPVYAVDFTDDSRAVVTADGAHVLPIWDACTACGDAKALLAIAKSRVTRQLTAQEQRTFLGQ